MECHCCIRKSKKTMCFDYFSFLSCDYLGFLNYCERREPYNARVDIQSSKLSNNHKSNTNKHPSEKFTVEQADVIVYRRLQAELKNKNLGCKAEGQAYGLYLVNIVDRFTSLNFNALLKQHAPLPEKYLILKGKVGSILKADAYSQRKRGREKEIVISFLRK